MKAVSTMPGTKQRILTIAGTAVLALGLALGAADASAQPGRNGDRPGRDADARQLQRGDMGRRSDPREHQREMMREREDMRRGMHHLSPEERRQLRRDIRDHGRDVYGDRDARRRNGPQR